MSMTDESTVLAKIERAHIFSASVKNGGISLIENCDYYYDLTLTPAEVRRLAAELVALADKAEASQ